MNAIAKIQEKAIGEWFEKTHGQRFAALMSLHGALCAAPFTLAQSPTRS